jgi:hypothetical protein
MRRKRLTNDCVEQSPGRIDSDQVSTATLKSIRKGDFCATLTIPLDSPAFAIRNVSAAGNFLSLGKPFVTATGLISILTIID